MSSIMSVIVCYTIVGLCLIVAVSLFSERRIFLSILSIIFGIGVMIQMSGEIGWVRVFLPVIGVVSITLLVNLVRFIWIMTRPKPEETSNKEVQSTEPVYTEEDIRMSE